MSPSLQPSDDPIQRPRISSLSEGLDDDDADQSQKDEPAVIQLVKGSVEEVKLKGHDFCLKLTSTQNGEKIIFLSFSNSKEYEQWLRRCKKVCSFDAQLPYKGKDGDILDTGVAKGPELIPVLSSQPAGDRSMHKPGGMKKLPLLSAMLTITFQASESSLRFGRYQITQSCGFPLLKNSGVDP